MRKISILVFCWLSLPEIYTCRVLIDEFDNKHNSGVSQS